MKPHEEWISKANSDLRAAKKLSAGNDPVLDVAIYHTQQCAEKALKGFIAFQNGTLQKTHDLRLLHDKCVVYDSSLTSLTTEIDILNPYSIMYRYPDIEMEPEPDQLKEAIAACERVLSVISNLTKSE